MNRKDTILENKYLKYVISSDGSNTSFINKNTGRNYIDSAMPNSFVEVVKNGRRYSSSSIRFDGERMTVSFEPLKTTITLKVRLLEEYVTFELSSINDSEVEEVTLANLNLTIRKNIGRILNIGLDEEFCACVLALNLQTRSYGGSASAASLMAKCYPRYGIVGSKIAVIGVPSNKIKEVLRQVQLNEGLPSPTLGGVWDKESPEVRKSYLFTTLSEQNVDEVIGYAKQGGFGYIMDIWNTDTHGHYVINRTSYPNGLDGMKKVVEKIHAAGLKAGLHFLTTCISKNDPYVAPVPDKRLAKDGFFVLAGDVDANSTFIPTKEPPEDAPREEGIGYAGGGLDIQIDDEIITYKGISLGPPHGFAGCIRGARGTKPAEHEKGAIVYHLAEMFRFYLADADSTLLEEITQRIADIVNECGYDMIYLDGAEAASLQGAWWYYIPKVELAFFRKFKREVLLQGASYTVSIYGGQGSRFKASDEEIDHFNWHIYSRDAQTDFVAKGVKGHVREVKLKGVRETLKNLMPAEFGWFGFFEAAPSYQATQPDEIEYICNKCVGYDSPLSLECSVEALRNNGWTAEALSIMKHYETLRLGNYFSEEEKAKLREPGAQFRLARVAEGKWRLRSLRHVEKYVESVDGVSNVWNVHNEFEPSSVELRIRPLLSFGHYDEAGNICLVDFQEEKPFSVSAKTGVSCRMESSAEEVKVGDRSGKLTARSSLQEDTGWCEFERRVDLDLSGNRGIGLWIFGDGKGEILNIQLKQEWAYVERACDHYIVIDFKGWKYHEIPEPEDERIFEYFKYTQDHYSISGRGLDYSRVSSVVLRLMRLPPGDAVTIYLSDVKALKEKTLPLKNPGLTIGGKTAMFVSEIQPGQCLIFKPEEDSCRLYSANGFPLKDVKVKGDIPALRKGDNKVVCDCDTSKGLSQKAKVRLTIIAKE